MVLPIAVYTPSSPFSNPGKLIRDIGRDLWAGRGLAWRLFLRDTAALYRQSILGYVWAVLPPLATSATFIFLNSQRVLRTGPTPVSYPAYVFVGTVLWQTFVDALNSPIRAVAANRTLLSRLNFPREALIVAGLLDVIFNSMIRLLLFVPVYWIFGVAVGASIFLFPIGFGGLVLLGLSMGLLLTPLSVLYNDITRGLTVITTFWLFLTPVVYPPPKFGLAAALMRFNPVSPVIITTRDWLISQPARHLGALSAITVLALFMFLFGALIYRVALPHLIERMGS